MESTSLFLTSNNYDSTSGDFILPFNSPQSLYDYEMTLVQSNVYKQWFNISPDLNNNLVNIKLPTAASRRTNGTLTGSVTYNVIAPFTIPTGFYTIDTLSVVLNAYMKEKGAITSLGQYAFSLGTSVDGKVVLTVNANPLKYSDSFGLFHQFCIISFGGSLADFLGLEPLVSYPQAESYSPSSSSITYSATSKPQLNPISSIVFTSNLAYNQIVNHPRGIVGASFIAGTDFGSSSSSANAKLTWLPVQPAIYNEIRISTYSQSGTKLTYIDTNSVFQVALRKRQK